MLKSRLVEVRDALAYQKLRNENHKSFFSQKQFTEEEVKDWLHNVIGSNDSSVYVYEDAGKIVGTVAIYNINNNRAEVGRIAVSQDRKGQGIGYAMLKEMEEFAALRGLQVLWAEVMLDNMPSKNLFLKAGYQIVREDSDRYVLELKVPPLSLEAYLKGDKK